MCPYAHTLTPVPSPPPTAHSNHARRMPYSATACMCMPSVVLLLWRATPPLQPPPTPPHPTPPPELRKLQFDDREEDFYSALYTQVGGSGGVWGGGDQKG
jgi:hypothetical protein